MDGERAISMTTGSGSEERAEKQEIVIGRERLRVTKTSKNFNCGSDLSGTMFGHQILQLSGHSGKKRLTSFRPLGFVCLQFQAMFCSWR